MLERNFQNINNFDPNDNQNKDLVQSFEILKEIFNNINTGISIFDVRGNGDLFILEDMNNTGAKLDNINNINNIIGKDILKIFPICVEFGLYGAMQTAYKTGEMQEIVIKYVKHNKQEAWRRNKLYKIYNNKIVSIYENITEQKIAEQKLIDSEQRYKTIFDNINDGLLVFDFKGKILEVNNKTSLFTKYNEKELINNNLFLLAKPVQIDAILRQLIKRDSLVFELPIIRKDGTIFSSSINAKVVSVLGEGRIQAFLRDISQIKRTQETLRISKIKAEESDRLKSAFLANMSHEIRTPLNGIIGFAQLLKKTIPANEKNSKFIDIINDNSKILLNIINDIIDLSKIESNQLDIYENPFEVNAVLYELYEIFSKELLTQEKEKIKLNINIPVDSCVINSDKDRFVQIFNNFLSNAVKFTNEGYIEYGYSFSKNNKIQFYIKDTGIGIPREKIDVIFERFTQIDYTVSRKYGGTGLGLAITKQLVKLLGGEIYVESEVEKGSAFYFNIPYEISNVKNLEIIENKEDALVIDWSDKTILVVEDEYINFSLIEEILQGFNPNIVHTYDGKEAIEIIKKAPKIDLILMDIKLPEISGLEVTKIIKSINSNIPIIAQTAYAMNEDKLKCYEYGCDDFIAKPIDDQELVFLIKKYL